MAKLLLEQVLEKKGITKYAFAKKFLKKEPCTVIPFFKAGYDPKLTTVVHWMKVLNVKFENLVDVNGRAGGKRAKHKVAARK